MGASLKIREYTDSDTADLGRAVKADIDGDAYEHGHNYSGHWGEKKGDGLSIENKQFDDRKLAYEYIENASQKHGPLLAVRAKVKVPVTLAAVYRAENAVSEFDKTIEGKHGLEWKERVRLYPRSNNDTGFYADHLKRLKSAKSKTKACPKCGHRYVVAHISSPDCYHCKSFDVFLTAAEQKRLARLNAKSDQLRSKVRDLRAVHEEAKRNNDKIRNTTCLKWVVGGWCAD